MAKKSANGIPTVPLSKRISKNRELYILMLPVVIYFLLFHYKPMLGLIIAFQDFKPRLGYFDSPWVGLTHFINFFTIIGIDNVTVIDGISVYLTQIFTSINLLRNCDRIIAANPNDRDPAFTNRGRNCCNCIIISICHHPDSFLIKKVPPRHPPIILVITWSKHFHYFNKYLKLYNRNYFNFITLKCQIRNFTR